ncbi:MAG: Trk system potassium transporter TrkA [Sphaerochaetaceae bacterium]|nr:Trk system potassium transporter TrkA [Sphaerochaetaceae bacterium]MDC7247607.1 Trk system potassium transporter TrkA [Sphaerochaetaceae bacterium]
MKDVILGAGKRGTLLARHLIQEKRDVVIIESDPKRAKEIQNKLDCMVVIGSGTDIEKLKEAEVQKASSFVAVTDSDEVNLVACGLVETIETKVNTIAAIRNLTYTGKEGLPSTVLGINYIVNPEAEAAKSIFNIIDHGVFHDVVVTFNESSMALYNIHVGDRSPFARQNVANCRTSLKTEFVIAAINRHGDGIVPSGNTVIYPGDILSIVVFDNDKDTLLTLIGQKKLVPKKIIIVGGSKIARFLLKDFSPGFHKNITLVEQDPQVAQTFADLFPNILVVQSDITDESIFEDERFSSYDLLISVTDNDELNVITSSYAKQVSVQKTIALIKNNNNYVRLASHMGIDSVISVSEATVDSLLKYLRGSHVSSVHSLFGGQFEIFEFVISSTMAVSGKKIKDINMRNKGVIAGITSKGKNLIPTGAYRIEPGDILIVCAGRENIGFISQIFA